jgi:hypothetical protein
MYFSICCIDFNDRGQQVSRKSHLSEVTVKQLFKENNIDLDDKEGFAEYLKKQGWFYSFTLNHGHVYKAPKNDDMSLLEKKMLEKSTQMNVEALLIRMEILEKQCQRNTRELIEKDCEIYDLKERITMLERKCLSKSHINIELPLCSAPCEVKVKEQPSKNLMEDVEKKHQVLEDNSHHLSPNILKKPDH